MNIVQRVSKNLNLVQWDLEQLKKIKLKKLKKIKKILKILCDLIYEMFILHYL